MTKLEREAVKRLNALVADMAVATDDIDELMRLVAVLAAHLATVLEGETK